MIPMTYFWKPGHFENSENKPRRAGFELEFGNVYVKETAQALQNALGGKISEINPFVFKIENSSLGNLKVKRDAELLNSVKHRETLRKIPIDFYPGTLASEIEEGIDKLSSLLIPCEIVTEALLFEDFSKLDEVVKILNKLKAKGTQDSIVNAFGLHINPSVPDLEVKTLVKYMQSFLLLVDWIIMDSGIDFTRRFFTSYIDPFSESYFKKILDLAYAPDMETLIDDYLEFNPTRNRSLDMLPILCEIDCDRVMAGVKKEERSLINGRPAFHYRLPDCRLGDKSWMISHEWNRWWYVEILASDDNLRFELIDRWNENSRRFFMTRNTQWIQTVKNFLADHIKPKGKES
jgi:hypothetical protein